MAAVALDSDLHGLIEFHSRNNPETSALVAAGRRPLTYRRLCAQVESVAEQLNRSGIGRGDRVAVVLPNGPEMAVAFLAVASAAVCAPLNPAYRAEEFDFYLSDLNARALLADSNVESAVVAVARKRGIPVLTLSPDLKAEAGVFALEGPENEPAGRPGLAGPNEIALVLHTSGTTSRPKIVPLTHQNLCTSARNVQVALSLTETDRCLNVMPLFHIHGLVAALLGSLASGGSVVCTPGFFAPSFFNWVDEFQPTWYTAVPTMHQSILARGAVNSPTMERRPLRFVRSSSAALPPKVMANLEAFFGAPVIEAYGMTEAAHQMATNPLPPRLRKPGTVGLPAGPEIGIMNEEGDILTAGKSGEIVIRGPNVTSGYESNPGANQSAFAKGWFRTGDQGFIDHEGYLSITGRLKELINRGGEKISPREVDEVLLDHPAVAQAVTFAVADPKLGEEIGAALVLRAGSVATEMEIRAFAAQRLVHFKVPRWIRFLDEIPKGPTGKLQRIGLAEKLKIQPFEEERAPHREASTLVEKMLGAIWMEVLKLQQVGLDDSFLSLGGDSILATQAVSRIRARLEVELSLLTFFNARTLSKLAEAVEAIQLDDRTVGTELSSHG